MTPAPGSSQSRAWAKSPAWKWARPPRHQGHRLERRRMGQVQDVGHRAHGRGGSAGRGPGWPCRWRCRAGAATGPARPGTPGHRRAPPRTTWDRRPPARGCPRRSPPNPSTPLRIPRRRLTSWRPARTVSGTSVIQRMTVAISPFSKTSEPWPMMTSRAASQFRAWRRYSTPASTSPRCQVPRSSSIEQAGFGVGLFRPQFETQHVPEEMVEAEPLTAGVQWDEEHRLALQLLEDELGVGRAGQVTDQFRTHPVQDGDLEHELLTGNRLGVQDLLTEIVGDQPVVSAELGDELVGVFVEPEGHPGQLQPGGPTFGASHQGGDAVGLECPSRDALEEHGRVDLIERQVDLADLGELPGQPMPAPGDGEVGPGGQDQMDVPGKAVDQVSEVGEEHRVGQMVEIVEDDDHFGELGQLGLECLQQGCLPARRRAGRPTRRDRRSPGRWR